MDEYMSFQENIQFKIKQYLYSLLSKVLKADTEYLYEIGTFQSMGVDSLISLELIEVLEPYFGTLPTALFYNYSTVEELADYLYKEYSEEVRVLFQNKQEELSAYEARTYIRENCEARIEYGQESIIGDETPENDLEEIAVIGIAGKYPGANTITELWENITEGKDCITEIPSDRWNWKEITPNGNRWGGFIEGVRDFDANFFGITEAQAKEMDPQERLLMETIWSMLEDAGYPGKALSAMKEKVGVYAGLMYNTYEIHTAKAWETGEKVHTQPAFWMIPNRLSYFFDLKGPSMAVDTACSSSLTALHLACNGIRSKECSAAIVCGVNLILHPFQNVRLDEGGQLSKQGKTKSFSEEASGFVEGEGVGAVLLKPLKNAVRDRDNIYGVIKGSALNHNGNTAGFTYPKVQGLQDVIGTAIKNSRVKPESIGYIEAHATGTILGDSMEIDALGRAFAGIKDEQMCSVGSIKSNVGHLEAASGICGLTKVLLQLKYGKLVPSIHCRPFSKSINFDSTPFCIQETLMDWNPSMELKNNKIVCLPRRAMLNSFGAGGSNACFILEEHKEKQLETTNLKRFIFVFSARNNTSLNGLIKSFYKYSANMTELNAIKLVDMAYTLQICREAMEERIAFSASDREEFLRKLGLAVSGTYTEKEIFTGSCRKELLTERNLQICETDEIAELWVKGYRIPWKKLFYEDVCRFKISLPTYFFSHKKYWVGDEQTKDTLSRSWYFDSGNILVKNHISFGKKTMPGSLLILLARELLNNFGEDLKVPIIKNFLFHNILTFEGTDMAKIICSLNQQQLSIESDVYEDKSDFKKLLAQAEIAFTSNYNSYVVEIPIFKNKSNGGLLYNKKPGVYGEDLRVVNAFMISDGRIWSEIIISDELGKIKHELDAAAAIIDGAFISRIALFMNQPEDTLIPLLIEEIIFFKAMDSRSYCRLEQVNSNQQFWRGNIEIFDGLGNICLALNGCTFKSAGQSLEGIKMGEFMNKKILHMDKSTKDRISQYLQKKLTELLGRAVLNEEQNFIEMGIQSIQLITLAREIEKDMEITLYPTIFFEYSNLKEFVDFLAMRMEKSDKSIEQQHGSYLKISDKNTDTEIEGVNNLSKEEVAIVGFSAVLPQSDDLYSFWNKLINGDDFITMIPKDRVNFSAYAENSDSKSKDILNYKGGFLKDIKGFDAAFFGITPREAELMDPQQRISLELAWNALEDAGYNPPKLAGSDTGVFIGVSGHDYKNVINQCKVSSQVQAILGNAHNVLTGRISYLFDFKGPSEPIDNACASSLVAINRGVECIQNGICGLVLAGGINIIADSELYTAFDSMGILSKNGTCCAFDEKADGTVRGEGGAIVVLKPLSKAKEDKNHIYAVIKGNSVNHGGHASSFTAPNVNQQSKVIVDTLKKSNVDPSTVTYIEAHGTGTKLGDPIEFQAITKAYEHVYQSMGIAYTGIKNCGIGTVKSNIGHLEAASGIAGVIKVLLSMKYGVIPAMPHLKEINPYILIEDTPFYFTDKNMEWVRKTDSNNQELPYRAQVQSFGLSGVNACIILEEYLSQNTRIQEQDEYCIVLSAKSETALHAQASKLMTFLFSDYQAGANNNAQDLADSFVDVKKVRELSLTELAYTLQEGRADFSYRLALLVKNKEELYQKLKEYLQEKKPIHGVFSGSGLSSRDNIYKVIRGDLEIQIMETLLQKRDLSQLAALWAEGMNVADWNILYSLTPKRISIPGYSFEHQPYWVSNKNDYSLLEQQNEKKGEKTKNTEKNEENQENKSNDIYMNRFIHDLILIVSEISHISECDISTMSNLDEQGFDSVTLTEFANRINETFNTEISPAIFFEIVDLNIENLAIYLMDTQKELIAEHYQE